MTVFENDHVGRKIIRQGLYEKENLSLLADILSRIPSAVVLDVGANIGNHTLAFSQRAAQVHAFEPLPRAFTLLKRNIAQNSLDNAHAYKVALSDENAPATLYMVAEGNLGASSFDRRQTDVQPVTVEKRIGDELLAELSVSKVDLIKLDVEAHELFALRGLMETLAHHRPFIAMEWNDPLTIERLTDSPELRFLRREYTIHVMGSNYDRGYWRGEAFAFVRRKWTRLVKERLPRLYAFDPARIYKNLLLVPKGKERCVDERYLR